MFHIERISVKRYFSLRVSLYWYIFLYSVNNLMHQ